jgi:uncharacterized protein
MPSDASTNRIGGLEALIRAQVAKGSAPVELWDPPYCGDIGLRIRADGTWLYRDSPIGRPALVKLFASVLRKDADGRHYLVTPVEKIDVAVDDAPLLAVEMEVRGAGTSQSLIFRTNVDDVVPAGAEHPLRFGRLEALVTRALAYDLVEIAVEEQGRGLGVWSGGACFPIPDSTPGDIPIRREP